MNKNCREGSHTFERDELNKNRFVCTHCGLEKDISIRPPDNGNTPLVFAIVLLIVYLLNTYNQPQSKFKKQIVETPQYNKVLKDVN